ncbi:MAG: hypothetical protein EBX92_05165, partial [Actinobacteria bacterium]|nr:hypothetical protein [Actinomycetota bacterium]
MTKPTDEEVKYRELSSSIQKLISERASGGVVSGSLDEDEKLIFNYADMIVSAHLRYHYDGHMVREGGTLLLVFNTVVTRAPRDMKSLLTESQIDLTLRSMVQHFHQLPLELGAWGIDVGRRRKAFECKRKERTANVAGATAVKDDFDDDSSESENQQSTNSDTQKVAETKTHVIDEDLLAESLRALDELIGLESVKKEIEGLVAVTKYNITRSESGLATPPFAPHLVFVGNPGTAKTTVASHVARIYHALGLLEKEQVKVVSRV